MKNHKISHCSDECLLTEIKNSETVENENRGIESWKEKADPWN